MKLMEKGTHRQRSGKGTIRKRFPLLKRKWEKKLNNQSGTGVSKAVTEQCMLPKQDFNFVNLKSCSVH